MLVSIFSSWENWSNLTQRKKKGRQQGKRRPRSAKPVGHAQARCFLGTKSLLVQIAFVLSAHLQCLLKQISSYLQFSTCVQLAGPDFLLFFRRHFAFLMECELSLFIVFRKQSNLALKPLHRFLLRQSEARRAGVETTTIKNKPTCNQPRARKTFVSPVSSGRH